MNSERDQFIEYFNLASSQIEKFDIYVSLLLKWQKTINLIAPSTKDHIWSRHFYDSGQLALLAPEAKKWIDMGSGAGFPALVCAILLGDKAEFHLIESDQRKCAFLRTVSRETSLHVHVHNNRIEEIIGDFSSVDIISARALASLKQLIDFSRPLLEEGGRGLFLKGQDVVSELTEITINSRLNIELIKSQTSNQSRIVDVRLTL